MKASIKTNRTLRAEMTVFLGMTIMLILSLFFSLLEVVHYFSIKKERILLADIATESFFADYCRPLWETYGVLGLDMGFGSDNADPSFAGERIMGVVADNITVPDDVVGGHHLVIGAELVELDSYGLLTDAGGVPFMKECAKSALYGIPEETIERLKGEENAYEDADMNWEDSLSKGQSAYEQAMEEKQAAEKAAEEEDADEDAEEDADEDADDMDEEEPEEEEEPPWDETALSKEEAESVGNPIEAVISWKNDGVLDQIISEEKVSDEKLLLESPVSKRSLSEGKSENTPSLSATERLLYQYYLTDKFSFFTDQKERDGIKYELEYIVGKEIGYKDNLAGVVEKLITYRGAMNMASILEDETKLSEAHAVAVALGGISANPLIVEAINAGVIAAWVYIESVMDARTLLRGGKIAIIKTPADWTSQILSLPACMNINALAKESPSGINYKACLSAIMSMTSGDQIALRALDLVENELTQKEGYKSVKMDNMLYDATIEYRFSGAPIFGSLVVIGRAPNGYGFVEKKRMSYIE